MPSFRPTPDGVRIDFDDQEAGILRRLAEEMRGLLEGKSESDPVVRRLFPDAYDEPEEQASWASLVGDDLDRHKRAAIEKVSIALGREGHPASVTVEGDEVDTWLAFVTDLRLAIGTRIDVDEERMSSEVDPADPEAPAMTLLHWLGWIQEEILRAVS